MAFPMRITIMAVVRSLRPRNILAVVGAASLVFFALKASCGRSEDRDPPARILMVKPMPRWKPPARFAVTLPLSSRAKDFKPGPRVEVETIQAKTPRADREVRDRFGLGPKEPILNLRDLPRLPYGGDLTTTVRDNRVETTVRAFKAPWFDWSWRHDLSLRFMRLYDPGGPFTVRDFGYEPVEVRIKDRVRVYPEVGIMKIPGTLIEGEYFGITVKIALGKKDRR